MHPIERLRYVARAEGASVGVLVEETAAALRSFARDPQALVTACRRIVARQPAVGPLWWLAARVLTATDPATELATVVEEFAADRTPRQVADALAEDARLCVIGWPELTVSGLPRRGDIEVLVVDDGGESRGLVTRLLRADVDACPIPLSGLGAAAVAADVVVLESDLVGPGRALAPAGSRALAAVARSADRPVWLTVGVGRVFPERMFDPIVERLTPADEPWEGAWEEIPFDLVDHVVGPRGLRAPDDAVAHPDCPVAPELFGGL